MDDGEPIYEISALGGFRSVGELGVDALALCAKKDYVPKMSIKPSEWNSDCIEKSRASMHKERNSSFANV